MSEIGIIKQTFLTSFPLENKAEDTLESSNQQVQQELLKADQNGDGKTSIPEFRNYLEVKAQWDEQSFLYDLYHDKYLPTLEKQVENIAKVYDLDISVMDSNREKELLQYSRITIAQMALRKNKTANIDNIDDKTKLELINEFVLSPDYLHMQYSNSEADIPLGKLGAQLPAEIYSGDERIADCYELSHLVYTIAKDIGMKVNIVKVVFNEVLDHVYTIDDKKINMLDRVEHAITQFEINGSLYYYDITTKSPEMKFKELTSIAEKIQIKACSTEVDLYDEIDGYSNYFLESAREMMKAGQRSSLYRFQYFDKAKDLMEISYLIDTQIDTDLIRLMYSFRVTYDYYDKKINYGNEFLNQMKVNNNQLTANYLIRELEEKDPLCLYEAMFHNRNYQDSEILNKVIENIEKAKKSNLNGVSYLKMN